MISPISLKSEFIRDGEKFSFDSGPCNGQILATFSMEDDRYYIKAVNEHMNLGAISYSYKEMLHRMMSYAYMFMAEHYMKEHRAAVTPTMSQDELRDKTVMAVDGITNPIDRARAAAKALGFEMPDDDISVRYFSTDNETMMRYVESKVSFRVDTGQHIG